MGILKERQLGAQACLPGKWIDEKDCPISEVFIAWVSAKQACKSGVRERDGFVVRGATINRRKMQIIWKRLSIDPEHGPLRLQSQNVGLAALL